MFFVLTKQNDDEGNDETNDLISKSWAQMNWEEDKTKKCVSINSIELVKLHPGVNKAEYAILEE